MNVTNNEYYGEEQFNNVKLTKHHRWLFGAIHKQFDRIMPTLKNRNRRTLTVVHKERARI